MARQLTAYSCSGSCRPLHGLARGLGTRSQGFTPLATSYRPLRGLFFYGIGRYTYIPNTSGGSKAQRITRPTFPSNSLEEGIVNALVHRDYASSSGSVSVSVYPDRLEIRNSGRLPKGLTAKMREMAQHASILINPDISHIFYLRGLTERVVRGTSREGESRR